MAQAPERKAEYQRQYRAANPGRDAAWQRHHRQTNAERMPALDRVRNLRKVGITPEIYAEMLAEQGGRCAICGSVEPGGNGVFHVDHDHACCPQRRGCPSCIRGLLCAPCNLGIGIFRDDPKLLVAALEYLTTSKEH